MNLPSRLVAAAGVVCLASLPALAAPVAGFGKLAPFAVQNPGPKTSPTCYEPEDNGSDNGEGDGEGDGEGSGTGSFLTNLYLDLLIDDMVVQVDCEGSGSNFDKTGPGTTDTVVNSLERGTEHCGMYTDVWRIDCLANELERTAQKMPKTTQYRQAKSDILEAAAKLRALAQQNADPAQPPVRRAAKVGNTTRTTTRPITPVAPSRVVAANRQADAVISELSTTLLRSAGNSATTARELTRVAQAVDSTKVLLRST